MSSSTVDNPFFARLWTVMSGHEPESLRQLRRENLAGLSGRVLEVGAGTGTNFEFYPGTVTEVVAVEPERRLAALAQEAAGRASVPVTVGTDTVEQFLTDQPFDAVVCSLVLCSVDQPDDVVRQLLSLLRPGGELRYLEHVAGGGPRARTAEDRRCDDVAEAARQLPHAPSHRADHPRRRVRGRRRATRAGIAGVGAGTGDRVRDRPGDPARLGSAFENGLSPAARAAAAAVRVEQWRPIRAAMTVALSDSGVGSGLTSMTVVPLASANSGSPAAG